MKKFGDRLKELRLSRKLSQEELAKKFNTGKASICNYEKNLRLPDVNSIAKFANYFGVSVDYILGLTDNRKEVTPNADEYNAVIKRAKDSNVSADKLDMLIDILEGGKK